MKKFAVLLVVMIVVNVTGIARASVDSDFKEVVGWSFGSPAGTRFPVDPSVEYQ